MPVRVEHGGGGVDDAERKKRKRPETAATSTAIREGGATPPPASEVAPTRTPVERPAPRLRDVTTVGGRIAVVEKLTNGALPKEVSWNLGSSSVSTQDLARVSRLYARQFDLPVDDYFNPVRTEDLRGNSLLRYEDPLNPGQTLSLRSARRLLEGAEADIIAQWLQRQEGREASAAPADPATSRLEGKAAEPTPGRRKVKAGRPAISSKAIIRELDQLTALLGEDLGFGQALLVARDVAGSGHRKEFGQNLKLLATGALANDPMMAIAVARQAADKGIAFADFGDAVAFLAGTTKERVSAGVAAQGREGELTFVEDGQVITAGVGDVAVFGKLYEALRNTETSYIEEADRILAEMEHQQSDEGIGQKFLDAGMTALEIANRPLEAFQRVFADPDIYLTWDAYDASGQTHAGKALEDVWDILTGDASLYEMPAMEEYGWTPGELMAWQMAFSLALPTGAGAKAFAQAGSTSMKVKAGLVFGGELVLDPLVGLGKVGKVAGQRRYLPFLTPAAQGKAINSLLTKPVKRLGNTDVPTYLVRAALKEENPETYFRRAVQSFRSTFTSDGIHPLVARSIYSWVRKGAAEGLDEDTLARGVRGFFADALGLPVKDPLAREIVALTEANSKASLKKARNLREFLGAQDELDAARRAGQQLQDQLVRAGDDFLAPVMHEVPHIRTIRGRKGAVRDLFGMSPASESAAARAARATRIMDLPLRSGNYFRFAPDQDPVAAVDGIERVMTRSRVFSQGEISKYRQGFTSAMRKGNLTREADMTRQLAILEQDMLGRLGKQLGVKTEDLTNWTEEMFSTSGRSGRRQVFGSTRAGKEITDPLLPSQLTNTFDLLDPVAVRRAVRMQIGYARELRGAAFRAIGKDAPITKGAKSITPSRIMQQYISQPYLRPALGLMKFGWVARPAYVLRIVFGDEFLRFLGTEGLAARVNAGRKFARQAAKSGVTPRDLELAIRTGLDPDEAIELRLTGLLEDEAQANQGAIKVLSTPGTDILPAEVEGAFIDQWSTLQRGAPGVKEEVFDAAWFRALFQYGQDATGREILQARLAGLDEEDAIERVLAWHRTDDVGKAAFKQMQQVEGYDLEASTRLAVEYLYDLTPNGSVAEFALDGSLSAKMLGTLPNKPAIVHGPALTPVGVKGGAATLAKAWGRLILEHPTNKLIRQPFYKTNYARTYAFLREQAIAAGKVVKNASTGVRPKLIQGRKSRTLPDLEGEVLAARETKGDAEGYVYHLTNPSNRAAIAEDGLVPRQSFYGTAADMVPEEMRAGRVFFADSIDRSVELVPDNGEPFMALRVKASDVGESTPERLFTGSQYTFHGIDPRKLEMLGADGKWHPFLDSLDQAAGDLPAQMDWALKQEAKRYAINRTREVMFDFTRTGRMAELLWFVSPFFQPFTEFLVAWPKIIKQNPALAGYALRLGQAANESGLFKTDENTGELTVPMSNFLGAAPLMRAVLGGIPEKGMGGGWELLTPLSAMNMFMTSAFPVEVGGVDVGIPTPSLSPPAQWVLQQVIRRADIDEDNKARLMAWATEYGEVDFTRPQQFILPTWMERVFMGAVPSWFDDETNRNTNRFMAMQQAMGLPVDEQAAHWQAQKFSLARAAISAFFPGAPRIYFPTKDLETEWNELVEANGGDTLAAQEEFAGTWNPDTRQYEGGRHPGLTLITLSKTMWADDQNPFSMPATQAVERILGTEGGKKFAKQFPRWVFFIIPKELREGEVDMGVLNAQIADGRRKIRTPSQFLEAADVQQGWNAYFAVKEQWDAWQQAHPDVEAGDGSYDARQGIFNEQVKTIAEEFPRWQGANEITIGRGVDVNVMREARILASSEEFTKTDLGAGLAEFFAGRDKLEQDMARVGVSNLATVAAEDAGFVKRWENLTEGISERHPDFARVFDLYFEGDLQAVKTDYDKQLDALAPEERKALTKWSDEWEERRSAPYAGDAVTDEQKFARYAAIRDWANTAYSTPGPNPLKLWWKGQTPNGKADYVASISNRSPVYWSRFDWDIMGLKPTKATTNFWTRIDEQRSAAFDRDSRDPDYSLGQALDAIDKQIAQEAKKNPAIAEQLKVVNKWGYGLEQLVFGKVIKDGSPFELRKTRDDWKDVFDAVDTIQTYANRYGLTGVDDFDPDNAVYYKTIKDAFGEYIESKRKNSRVFTQQWDYLQSLLGADRVISVLMPDSYFPLGVVDG